MGKGGAGDRRRQENGGKKMGADPEEGSLVKKMGTKRWKKAGAGTAGGKKMEAKRWGADSGRGKFCHVVVSPFAITCGARRPNETTANEIGGRARLSSARRENGQNGLKFKRIGRPAAR